MARALRTMPMFLRAGGLRCMIAPPPRWVSIQVACGGIAAISGWHRPEVAFDPYQAPIAASYAEGSLSQQHRRSSRGGQAKRPLGPERRRLPVRTVPGQRQVPDTNNRSKPDRIQAQALIRVLSGEKTNSQTGA